jgi:hypothetical protein
MTRCPIHARRFYRLCLQTDGDGSVAIQTLSGEPCCQHMRHRRFRIHTSHSAARRPQRTDPSFMAGAVPMQEARPLVREKRRAG